MNYMIYFRPNIYIHSIPKSTCKIVTELMWVVDLLMEGACPKIIIFAHSATTVTKIYNELMDTLEDFAYVNNEKRVKCRRLEMYTSSTAENDKKRIIADYINGVIDVLVATVAVGLGVNFPKVRNECIYIKSITIYLYQALCIGFYFYRQE